MGQSELVEVRVVWANLSMVRILRSVIVQGQRQVFQHNPLSRLSLGYGVDC